MRNIKLIILVLLLLNNTGMKGQYYFHKLHELEFGGDNYEYGNFRTMIKTNDNGYLIFGGSASTKSGTKTVYSCPDSAILPDYNTDGYVIKLDSNFQIQWDQVYGGSEPDYFNCAIQTRDDGYLLGGVSNSPISCSKSQNHHGQGDYWIVRVDGSGNKMWDKRYGGVGEDLLNEIIEAPDSGFMLFGTSSSPVGFEVSDTSNGARDVWVIKINKNGIKQWDKMYGSSYNEILNGARLTTAGNYILTNVTKNIIADGDITANGWGGAWDGWICMIDPYGNIIWEKRHGASGNEFLFDSYECPNGDLFFCGWIDSSSFGGTIIDSTKYGWFDIILIRTDSVGNPINDKIIGGSNSDFSMNMIPIPNGHFLIIGVSRSGIGYDKTEYNRGLNDWWILEVDSSFNIIWNKTLGGSADEAWPSVVLNKDGSLVGCSWTSSDVSGDKTTPSFDVPCCPGDFWMVHFNMDSLTTIEEILSDNPFKLWPNPATNTIQISFDKTLNKNTPLQVFDLTGRMVYSKEINRNEKKVMVDVSILGQGTYFVKVDARVRKFVKM